MKFYAYIPDASGNDTCGMIDWSIKPGGKMKKALFELKTVRGAHRKAQRLLGGRYKLFSYTNFYDDKTFTEHIA